MKCPFCGKPDSHVLDSRPVKEGSAIRRRRECGECDQRFTTFEEVEHRPLMVIKRDGSREPFNREKIRQGILLSCRKRPVSTEQMDMAVDAVDSAVLNRLVPEVSSGYIGELVMDQLLKIDPVAYVRFASVYRQFEDANEFREVVESLRKHRRQKDK